MAVEFDLVSALQHAIKMRTIPNSAQVVLGGPAAMTLGADGGPVRRRPVTAFNLSLSAPWLQSGRTAMLPATYLLVAEHHIHSALGDRLEKQLEAALCATYEVRVQVCGADGPSSGQTPQPSSATATDAWGGQAFVDWKWVGTLRVAGDVAMSSHLLGLTGGGEAARCPFRWPCRASCYLSMSAASWNVGRKRTAGDIAKQFETVAWMLARWCSLRSTHIEVGDGSVVLVCSYCSTKTVVGADVGSEIVCAAASCAAPGRRPATVLPVVRPSPMGAFFNRLRRRLGGVRSYPVLRSMPILIQPPIMHCTGNVVKALVFFFLAELGDEADRALRQRVYDATGRANLGHLYMREMVKLLALFLACDDIGGPEVDCAIKSMWGLAFIMTTSWRKAVSPVTSERERASAVLEVSAGLLAPLWAALKPLDKGQRSAGVRSSTCTPRSHMPVRRWGTTPRPRQLLSMTTSRARLRSSASTSTLASTTNLVRTPSPTW